MGFPVDFSMAVATWNWDGRSDVGMGLLQDTGVKEDSTQHTLTQQTCLLLKIRADFFLFAPEGVGVQLQLQS